MYAAVANPGETARELFETDSLQVAVATLVDFCLLDLIEYKHNHYAVYDGYTHIQSVNIHTLYTVCEEYMIDVASAMRHVLDTVDCDPLHM